MEEKKEDLNNYEEGIEELDEMDDLNDSVDDIIRQLHPRGGLILQLGLHDGTRFRV